MSTRDTDATDNGFTHYVTALASGPTYLSVLFVMFAYNEPRMFGNNKPNIQIGLQLQKNSFLERS